MVFDPIRFRAAYHDLNALKNSEELNPEIILRVIFMYLFFQALSSVDKSEMDDKTKKLIERYQKSIKDESWWKRYPELAIKVLQKVNPNEIVHHILGTLPNLLSSLGPKGVVLKTFEEYSNYVHTILEQVHQIFCEYEVILDLESVKTNYVNRADGRNRGEVTFESFLKRAFNTYKSNLQIFGVEM